MACNQARQFGAVEVQIGANAADQADYEDCRRDFFIAMHKATGLSIHAPLITKTKPEIITMARDLGFTKEDAWSCYEAGPEPCGVCPSCVESEAAWNA
jgi:7-cyano-7-deazaguanine synthase